MKATDPIIYAPKNDTELQDCFTFASATYKDQLAMLRDINARPGDQLSFVMFLINSMDVPLRTKIHLKTRFRQNLHERVS